MANPVIEAPAKRGRGRPRKTQASSAVPTAATRGIAKPKAKVNGQTLTAKSSSQQHSSPGVRTRSSYVSQHSYEEAGPSSIRRNARTQVPISNPSSPPQTKKPAFQNQSSLEASDAIIRKNQSRADALAESIAPLKADRVEWVDDKPDGTRWHMFRVLIRNSWPGQGYGEGILFAADEVQISGPGFASNERADGEMEGISPPNGNGIGAVGNGHGNATESVIYYDNVVRGSGLPTCTDAKPNDAQDGPLSVAVQGSSFQPGRKVQHPASAAGFEIYAEGGAEEASQVQVNPHAQAGQGEGAAMNANVVNGRAVLMPLELVAVTADLGVVSANMLAGGLNSIVNGSSSFLPANGLSLSPNAPLSPVGNLSSTPSPISEYLGVHGSGRMVAREGSDGSSKENDGGGGGGEGDALFAGDVSHDFAHRALRDDADVADLIIGAQVDGSPGSGSGEFALHFSVAQSQLAAPVTARLDIIDMTAEES